MAESVNDFVAGYISGAAGLLVGSPLDTIKVRMQAGFSQNHSRHLSLNHMIRTEGIMSLFKGIITPVIGLGGLNALLFASYGGILRHISANQDEPTLNQIFWAGFGAGVTCFLVSCPTELVKCRAQVKIGGDTAIATEGTWEVIRDIVQKSGIRGFYRGGLVTILRDAPGYGGYFWSYEWMKRYLEIPAEGATEHTGKLLLAGGVAGMISWACIYPLDVIKSRIQAQAHLDIHPPRISPTNSLQPQGIVTAPLLISTKSLHSSSTSISGQSYTGIIDCAVKSYRSEGIGVFFRGLAPTLLRAFPVNCVTFFVYEWVMAALSKKP
ncbi:uncharacterized protein VTP21DRAFT_7235 [Calcarisporiella thermophila]|uniref:uncharacterized protein n=1 Tax=Calcarisporiella thermophila TaxID=911321 RepID=UPI0037447EC7